MFTFYLCVEGLSCSFCPRGMFVAKVAATACINCPAGMVQPKRKQSSCVECGRGKFQNAGGKSKCHQCQAGWVVDKKQILINNTWSESSFCKKSIVVPFKRAVPVPVSCRDKSSKCEDFAVKVRDVKFLKTPNQCSMYCIS